MLLILPWCKMAARCKQVSSDLQLLIILNDCGNSTSNPNSVQYVSIKTLIKTVLLKPKILKTMIKSKIVIACRSLNKNTSFASRSWYQLVWSLCSRGTGPRFTMIVTRILRGSYHLRRFYDVRQIYKTLYEKYTKKLRDHLRQTYEHKLRAITIS